MVYVTCLQKLIFLIYSNIGKLLISSPILQFTFMSIIIILFPFSKFKINKILNSLDSEELITTPS